MKANQIVRPLVDWGGIAVYLAVYFATGKDVIKAS